MDGGGGGKEEGCEFKSAWYPWQQRWAGRAKFGKADHPGSGNSEPVMWLAEPPPECWQDRQWRRGCGDGAVRFVRSLWQTQVGTDGADVRPAEQRGKESHRNTPNASLGSLGFRWWVKHARQSDVCTCRRGLELTRVVQLYKKTDFLKCKVSS